MQSTRAPWLTLSRPRPTPKARPHSARIASRRGRAYFESQHSPPAAVCDHIGCSSRSAPHRHEKRWCWPQMKSARRAHGSAWRKWRASGQRWPGRAGAASSIESWAAVATSAARPLQQRQHGCNQILKPHGKKIPAGAIRRGRAGTKTIAEDIEASAAAGPPAAASRCAALRIAQAMERTKRAEGLPGCSFACTGDCKTGAQ